MRRPSNRLTITAILSLLVGYAISYVLFTGLLAAPYRLYGLKFLTFGAILCAILLLIFLDNPLNLRMFDWPTAEEERAKKEPSYWNQGILDWLMTVDHKKIGIMYFSFSFIFFLLGGLMALVIRAELAYRVSS